MSPLSPATTEPHHVLCDDGVLRPAWAATDGLMRAYYDEEWGKPVRDERGLYEALSLEAFQAGLSWSTVLRKRPAFRAAFAGFDPEVVARFEEADVERLLADERLIRNELKVRAVINNAGATLRLRPAGGLAALVWAHTPEGPHEEGVTSSPESAALAKALKKAGYKFVGPTTMYALMQAAGVIPSGRS